MSLVMPEGVPTLGNIAVKAVATIASPAAPKLATEINADAIKTALITDSAGRARRPRFGDWCRPVGAGPAPALMLLIE